MSADDYAYLTIGQPSGKFYVRFGFMSDEDSVDEVTVKTPCFDNARAALQFAEQANTEYGIRFGEDHDDPVSVTAAQELEAKWQELTADKNYRPKLGVYDLIAYRYNGMFSPINAMQIEWIGQEGNSNLIMIAGRCLFNTHQPVIRSCFDRGRDFLPIPNDWDFLERFKNGE